MENTGPEIISKRLKAIGGLARALSSSMHIPMPINEQLVGLIIILWMEPIEIPETWSDALSVAANAIGAGLNRLYAKGETTR